MLGSALVQFGSHLLLVALQHGAGVLPPGLQERRRAVRLPLRRVRRRVHPVLSVSLSYGHARCTSECWACRRPSDMSEPEWTAHAAWCQRRPTHSFEMWPLFHTDTHMADHASHATCAALPRMTLAD